MSLPTPEPQMLADYRAELIAAGLPDHVADQVVVSAADAVHRSTTPHEPTPAPEHDDPADLQAAIDARRAERAAELSKVAAADVVGVPAMDILMKEYGG